MELNNQLEILEKLCTLDGVSGCEDKAAEYIRSCLPQDCKVYTDVRGNLICEKKGRSTPKNKMMFAAHMDEVGFIINYIEESGLLRLSTVGDIDTRVVVGKAVRLESGKEGVIGAKPIHLQTAAERDEVLKFSSLYIDIGTKSREEAEQFVQLGDFATWRPNFMRLGNRISCKALDNRVGCLALIELMNSELEYDVTAVFTTQKEVGGGAGNAAFTVKPDIAVAVDAAAANDVPGVGAAKRGCELGKGAVLPFKEQGTFMDRELFEISKAICKEKEIPFQIKNQMAGTTDTASMSRAAGGCRVMSVGIPVRYIHSPSAVFEPKDIEPVVKLLGEMANRFANI